MFKILSLCSLRAKTKEKSYHLRRKIPLNVGSSPFIPRAFPPEHGITVPVPSPGETEPGHSPSAEQATPPLPAPPDPTRSRDLPDAEQVPGPDHIEG